MKTPQKELHRRALEAAGVGVVLIAADGCVTAMDERAFLLLDLAQHFASARAVSGSTSAKVRLFPPPAMGRTPCVQEIPRAAGAASLRAEWLPTEDGGFTVLLQEAGSLPITAQASQEMPPLISLLKGLPGMMSVSERISGRYVAVNDEWVAQTGYAAENCIGKTSLDMGIISEETFDKVRRWAAETDATGEIELDYTNAQGKQRRVVYMCRPIIFEGRDCIVSCSIDVSGLHAARERLRASEELFSRTFAASPTMMALTRMSDGVAMAVNRSWCENTGWSEQEVIGRSYLDINVVESSVQERLLDAFLNKGETGPFDASYLTREGVERKAMFGLERVEVGGVECLLTVANDITNRVRAEEALQASEQLFSKAFSASPTMMALSRVEDSVLIAVNRSWRMHTGWTEEEAVGKRSTELGVLNPETRRSVVDRFVSKGGFGETDVAYYRKDGEERRALFALQRIDVGGVECLLTVANDITDRVRAEEALRTSEAQFAKVFHSSPAMMSVYRRPGFEVVDVNPAWCSHTGYTREEVVGRSTAELDMISSEKREQLADHFGEGRNTAHVELEYRPKSGPMRTALLSLVPIEVGDEPCFLMTAIDTTELLQRRRELQETELRLQEMASNIRDVFWITNHDLSQLLYINEAYETVFGHSREELFADQGAFVRAIHEEDRDRIWALIQKAPVEEPLAAEFRIRRPDRSVRWADCRVSPIRDADENVVRLAGVLTDITERKRAEEALAEREVRYSTLFASSSDAILVETPAGEVLDANPAACELFGYTPREWRGFDARALLPPEGRSWVDELTMHDPPPPQVNMELEAQRKSGERFIADMRSVRAQTGQEELVFVILRDVTQKRRDENRLRESERRYRLITECIASFAYAYALDEDGRTQVLWQEGAIEQVTGRKKEEAQWPADWAALLVSEDMGVAARHREHLHRGEPHDAEFRIVRPDGSLRWIRDYGQPFAITTEGAGEGQSGVVGAVQDVTERRRAQSALEESEEKYRRLFEMESDALFLIDNQSGAILDVNAAAERLYGYAREELLSLRNTDLSAEPEATQQATRRELPKIELRHHRRRDGTVFPVEITAAFFQFRERPVHIAAIRDISERIQREEELREANELFAGFMDRFPGGAFIKSLDGRHLFMNRYFYEVLGAKDWQGHSDREVFPAAIAHRLAVEDQRAFSSGPVTLVEKFAGADGQTRSYRTTKFPIQRKGKPPILGGIALDITEQLLAEEMLRQSEARFRRLVRTMPHGLVQTDLEARIVLANEAFLTIAGVSEALSHGARLKDVLDPQGALTPEDFKPSKDPVRLPLPVEDPRQPRWVQLDWQAQFDEAGHLEGYLAVVTEVTGEELARRQQEQLMQADKMISLGVLVSGVAHEINNPNQFIMSHSGAIAEIWRELLPVLDRFHEEHGDFVLAGQPYSRRRGEIPLILGNIIEGSKRIKTIVRELRDYAREGANARPAPVGVNQAVESALALSSALLTKSTERFSAELAADLPPVMGWSQRIEQVVINLIQNACQALKSPSQAVRIVTQYDAGEKKVLVVVEDEGIGIDEEDLAHVADPFFTTKRESGGTGLGLSISSRIAADHGGRLHLTSRLGSGTCARVELPAYFEAADGTHARDPQHEDNENHA